MSDILYIKASPMEELSYSIRVARAFLERYSELHPEDNIKVFDLWTETLPDFDFAAASAKYKITHKQDYTTEEEQIWSRVVAVIDRFKAADKYVFSVPMWNFSIPYRLKQLFDVIVQQNYTFKVTEQGFEGLIKNKPVFLAYASGGSYQSEQMKKFDMQKSYMETILGYIGFTDFSSATSDSTLAGPETAEENLRKAQEKAKQLAENF